MDTTLGHVLTRLPKGALLHVRNPEDKGVAVFQGQAWVTQQNDPRDVLLGAGESFALDRLGMAIVQALEDTSLLVFETRPKVALPVSRPGPAGQRPMSGLSVSRKNAFALDSVDDGTTGFLDRVKNTTAVPV